MSSGYWDLTLPADARSSRPVRVYRWSLGWLLMVDFDSPTAYPDSPSAATPSSETPLHRAHLRRDPPVGQGDRRLGREQEGSQGRPQAARRGSLDGPGQRHEHTRTRSPPGLRGCAFAFTKEDPPDRTHEARARPGPGSSLVAPGPPSVREIWFGHRECWDTRTHTARGDPGSFQASPRRQDRSSTPALGLCSEPTTRERRCAPSSHQAWCASS